MPSTFTHAAATTNEMKFEKQEAPQKGEHDEPPNS